MTEEPRFSAEPEVEPEREPKITREEMKVSGSELVEKVKELLHEGNIRRIVIKQDGRTVIELPLTIAAVGVVFAPVLAAIGAFAALVSNCSIVVERIIEE
jgi:DNA-binding Lrp family transcriptional regulator